MPAVAVPSPIDTVTAVFTASAEDAVAVTVTDVAPASSLTLDGLTDSVTEAAARSPLAIVPETVGARSSLSAWALAGAGVQAQSSTASRAASAATVLTNRTGLSIGVWLRMVTTPYR